MKLRETSGFTLFEVLVVMSISAVLAQAAIVNFPELRRSLDRNAARQQLGFDLQRARSEALANGVRAVLVPNTTGEAYSVGIDEYPFSSTGAADRTLFMHQLPKDVTLSSSQAIIFSSSGYLINAAGDLTNTSVVLSDATGVILDGTLYSIGSIENN